MVKYSYISVVIYIYTFMYFTLFIHYYTLSNKNIRMCVYSFAIFPNFTKYFCSDKNNLKKNTYFCFEKNQY